MQTVNSFLFYSQCCVCRGCRGLIVPPAVTIREQDRTEIFIRRQIEIPVGSRCCKIHTVDKHLSAEAFLSVVPYKVEDRLFYRKSLTNLLQSYRLRVNSNKHLDFDEPLSLTDGDYVKLTGFTRNQHTQILSHIPSTALKNSTTRTARSALGYLLMKLKLGLSNSVLASMTGINSKRQMSHIISSARVALAQHFVPCYLGLAHLTRQEVIDKHTSPIASRLLTYDRDSCILVLDGTYLYIQVRYTPHFFKLKIFFERTEEPK